MPDPKAAAAAPAEPIKSLRTAAVAAADRTADPYVFSPKAPRCSSRWREQLEHKRATAAQSPSAKPSPLPAVAVKTPAARAANSTAARSLKLLHQQNIGRASGSWGTAALGAGQ